MCRLRYSWIYILDLLCGSILFTWILVISLQGSYCRFLWIYAYLCRSTHVLKWAACICVDFRRSITRSVGIYVVLHCRSTGICVVLQRSAFSPLQIRLDSRRSFNETLESMLIYQIGGLIYADQLWSMLIVTLICNKQKRIFVNHDSGIFDIWTSTHMDTHVTQHDSHDHTHDMTHKTHTHTGSNTGQHTHGHTTHNHTRHTRVTTHDTHDHNMSTWHTNVWQTAHDTPPTHTHDTHTHTCHTHSDTWTVWKLIILFAFCSQRWLFFESWRDIDGDFFCLIAVTVWHDDLRSDAWIWFVMCVCEVWVVAVCKRIGLVVMRSMSVCCGVYCDHVCARTVMGILFDHVPFGQCLFFNWHGFFCHLSWIRITDPRGSYRICVSSDCDQRSLVICMNHEFLDLCGFSLDPWIHQKDLLQIVLQMSWFIIRSFFVCCRSR